MGVWKKSPQADPAQIARIQAVIDPWLPALHKGAWGNTSAWQAIPRQVEQRLQQQGIRLPDGYGVDMTGKVVYTNKTPFLKQLAFAAAPIAGPWAAQSLAGLLTGAGASAGAGGAVGGVLPSSSLPVSALMGGPAAITSGAGTGASMAGNGFFGTVGKFFGSPGGAQVTDLAGGLLGNWMQTRGANRAADLANQYNTQALDYLKQQDARDFAEYLKERERDWRYQDEDRGRAEEMRQLGLLREREREGRLAPFREGAERGYQTLSSLLYNPQQPMGVPPPVSAAVQRRSLADLVRS